MLIAWPEWPERKETSMEPKYDEMAILDWIEEAAVEEGMSQSLYSHAVQVLTPIELLGQVDAMVKADKRLSRPIVFRRALRLYLKLLKHSGHAAGRTRTRKKPT
jgi:hypothetical protein